MFEPVKVAFGEYMVRFYNGLVPTTKSMQEFCTRGPAKSMAWALSGLADEPERMLDSWQRNDTDSAPTQPYKLPVILVAMAKDYMPTGRDFTRQIADSQWAIMPNDPKERAFGVRTLAGDIRTQVIIFAADEPTARSIAGQFCLFLDAATDNRRFLATYSFAGIDEQYPVAVESPDLPASRVQSEASNINILTIDITLKATVPLYDAPKVGEYNDGKGVPGTEDPAGYPVVVQVNKTWKEPIS